MSRRLGHSKFDYALGVSLDYLIHGSGRWDRVFGVERPCIGKISRHKKK